MGRNGACCLPRPPHANKRESAYRNRSQIRVKLIFNEPPCESPLPPRGLDASLVDIQLGNHDGAREHQK